MDAVKSLAGASPLAEPTLLDLSEADIASYDLSAPLATLGEYLTARKVITPDQRDRADALARAEAWESAVIALLPPGTSYSIGFFPDLGECVAQVTLRNIPGAHARGSGKAAGTLLLAFLAALKRAG